MPLDGGTIASSAVLAGVITAAGGAYAARQSRKVSDKKVDAEAYDRARSTNESITKDLREEIARLQADLKQTRDELRAEELTNKDLQEVIEKQVRRLNRMERRLEHCIRLLDQAGIPVPPPVVIEEGDQA